MTKRLKVALLILAMIALALLLTGCTEADKVSANISKEADNFNVLRRISVINMRTDKPLFELIGQFSIGNNSSRELTITVQTGPTEFKKHMIYLNDWTMYVVEDLGGASVSPFKYEINFQPEAIIPFTFTNSY